LELALILALLISVAVAFDIWRALDNSDVLGRPWPRVDRQKSPAAFWAMQLIRIAFVIMALFVLAHELRG